MNIAEWTLKNRTVNWVLTVALLALGYQAFNDLSRLEDPEFTIKEATVITPYPGASAAEVEEEVTDLIERAAQELGQLDYVESRSSRGLSIVKVFIKDKYDKDTLPQVWDELRRKIGDNQRNLPPGAGPSIVNDDFGDVYGIYYAITGEGYDSPELYEFAKFLRRELLTVQDVKRIIFWGVQEETVYVEMRREKMAELGIAPQDIYAALGAKNKVAHAGYITIGNERIAVNPTGEFSSEQEFGNLLIKARGEGSETIFLRDVATIVRGVKDPASKLLRYDGQPAVGLAISTASGGNVVTMGAAVDKKLEDLRSQVPAGVELNVVSHQADAVTTAIDGFLISLVEAVAIVIVVLFFFMGMRSGLIIGTVLVITIMGTFIFMKMFDITLERISLGALIIALGMLVDNAIVVTDGMQVRMAKGEKALAAARAVVGQTSTPLLGATAIAIAAFAAIGTSSDSTGEYCRSLFSVILISLSLSWFSAVTTTPLFCNAFLKVGGGEDNAGNDPYSGRFYQLYRRFLGTCIRGRWLTLAVVVGVFISSVFGFGFVKQSFFPDSTRPQFYVDVWLPEGTSIDVTAERLKAVENQLRSYDGVTHLTSQVGGGSPRFLLTYSPEYSYSSFARILVDVDDYRVMPELLPRVQSDLEKMVADGIVNTRAFILGPASGGKVQLRIMGPDGVELRKLASVAQRIIDEDYAERGLRSEWREPVKVVRPVMAESQARRAGIDRPDIAMAMAQAVDGIQTGWYREGDELLPIIARSPARERVDLNNLAQVPIWSPAAQRPIPLGQVVTDFSTEFEDGYIWRRDRVKMLRLHWDHRVGLSSELLNRVKPRVEQALNVDVDAHLGRDVSDDPFADHTAATLPIAWRGMMPIKGKPGYYIGWGGENEDSVRSQGKIQEALPVFFGIMVFIVIALFNSIKQTLVIWLAVPLALIGVTAGLLLTRQPFGFMALLGFMSLSGMLIKNAIVLVDQINLEISDGKPVFDAIVDSGVSRLIPVSMAALTTILGMLPLLQDAFFIAMAVTIMFGLGVATILTLVVVPVLYATFFQAEA
jgi:multidrug efflux pump subunit AcrB